MRRVARSDAPIVVALDRLVLLLMLLALAAVLTAAMVMQVVFGEIPCPLCLLQRVAMLGCCFGLIHQLHAEESERGTGIAMVFAVVLLVISVRQTLLDIVPRPGHEYVGSAVLGLHMPVWSVVIAVALLLGFALRFALFGAPRDVAPAPGTVVRRCARGLEIYVLLVAGLNLVAVVLQCGLGDCPTTGYRLL